MVQSHVPVLGVLPVQRTHCHMVLGAQDNNAPMVTLYQDLRRNFGPAPVGEHYHIRI